MHLQDLCTNRHTQNQWWHLQNVKGNFNLSLSTN